MEINLPEYVKEILAILEACHYEAYVVGGCIRDLLMGREPGDWDLATSAPPEEVMRLFEKAIPTGIRHGTVTVIYKSVPVEITTFRLEKGYSDARRPDRVFFTSNLYEDLARRDFTMNAIAYSPSRGLIDYFEGIKAIREGKIYCIGSPRERFAEDALRMMRAVRFAAKLNFSLDEAVTEAIRENRWLLARISRERIRDEFLKTLLAPHPEKFFIFTSTGLLETFLPELHALDPDIQKYIYSRLKNIPPAEKEARLAALFSPLPPEAPAGILRRLRFDNATIKSVASICLHMHCPIPDHGPGIRKIASQAGLANLKSMIWVWEALEMLDSKQLARIRDYYNEILEKNYCLDIAGLAVNGHDLIELGITDGKKIGTILRYLLGMVLENPALNNKEKLITIVKQNF